MVGSTPRAGTSAKTAQRSQGMRIPTPKRAARYLSAKMAPHLGHQMMWERQADGDIVCHECKELIIGPRDIQRSGVQLLSLEQKELVGNAIARWIRSRSPDDAKIIIPIHKP